MIKQIKSGEEMEYEINRFDFFQMPVQHVGESFMYIEISEIDQIQVYISPVVDYPNSHKCRWAYGVIDEEVQLKAENFMMEALDEANPFIIHPDTLQINYQPSFVDAERFKKPLMEDIEDDKIRQIQR